jgi:hypothetical protein
VTQNTATRLGLSTALRSRPKTEEPPNESRLIVILGLIFRERGKPGENFPLPGD